MTPIDLIDGFMCTDSGNAERLVALHGDGLRYVRGWSKWLSWNGPTWTADAGAPYRAAKDTARTLLGQASRVADDDKRKFLVSFAVRSESRKSIEATVSLARHDERVVIAHSQLDADPMLLNVRNGTIDLRTGKLRPHRQTDLITKVAPVVFDPAATAPTWDAFLARAMGGNVELVSYLQRMIGYALTGVIAEHVVGFMFGGGANGKSTFLSTVHNMLGDYATPAPRGMLFRSRGEQHPTSLATLFGRRFVTCSEVEDGQAFDEALVKDLTGGDPIECRRMREDFWTFLPTHKLFMAGNHKPTVRGDDEGIWRRMRLVPWTVTIPEAERDTTLAEKLRAELPGILAWAVRGCLAWQAMGLAEPEAVKVATRQYREENDALGEFFRLVVVFEVGATIARKELREAYTAWCAENGSEPFGAKRFAARLRERGVGETSVRRGIKVLDGWKGVRFATDAERVAASVWTERRDVGTCSASVPHSGPDTSRGPLTGNGSLHLTTTLQATQTPFADWVDGEIGGGE